MGRFSPKDIFSIFRLALPASLLFSRDWQLSRSHGMPAKVGPLRPSLWIGHFDPFGFAGKSLMSGASSRILASSGRTGFFFWAVTTTCTLCISTLTTESAGRNCGSPKSATVTSGYLAALIQTACSNQPARSPLSMPSSIRMKDRLPFLRVKLSPIFGGASMLTL